MRSTPNITAALNLVSTWDAFKDGPDLHATVCGFAAVAIDGHLVHVGQADLATDFALGATVINGGQGEAADVVLDSAAGFNGLAKTRNPAQCLGHVAVPLGK